MNTGKGVSKRISEWSYWSAVRQTSQREKWPYSFPKCKLPTVAGTNWEEGESLSVRLLSANCDYYTGLDILVTYFSQLK